MMCPRIRHEPEWRWLVQYAEPASLLQARAAPPPGFAPDGLQDVETLGGLAVCGEVPDSVVRMQVLCWDRCAATLLARVGYVLAIDSSSAAAASTASACACSAGACSVGIRTSVCGSGTDGLSFSVAASPDGFANLAVGTLLASGRARRH